MGYYLISMVRNHYFFVYFSSTKQKFSHCPISVLRIFFSSYYFVIKPLIYHAFFFEKKSWFCAIISAAKIFIFVVDRKNYGSLTQKVFRSALFFLYALLINNFIFIQSTRPHVWIFAQSWSSTVTEIYTLDYVLCLYSFRLCT